MTNYNEAVNGDISNNPENPLQLSLSEGANRVTATTGDRDQEYVTVTVPEGFQLNSVVLESYNPNDVAFIGVQEGDTFTEPLDDSAIRENILGYTLFGNPRQIGTDILDEIGNGLNAIGFEGALPSGNYTFALQQIGATSDYTLDFNVSSASTEPEPEPNPTPNPEPIPPTTAPTNAIVGLTVDKTDVVEGDSITLTLSVDGDIPAEGITVLVNDTNSVENQRRSLTEFDIFNIELAGISGIPIPAEGDSGFFVTVTEPTATITLPVFDEGANEDEAAEIFTFEVIDGEGYQVDSQNNAITISITDVEDANNPAPPINELPVISIDTLAGTFDADDNLITPNLVDSTAGVPILSVTINSNFPVPEDGLVVDINSDLADITELVDEPAFAPFVFGGEFVKAIYSDAGVATGFQVKLLNPNAIVNFSNVGLESEDVEDFNLFVEPSEGYTVSDTSSSSTVTIYNTLDQVPTTGTTPTVGMSIGENSLIEGETETTISFNVDGEIPPEGVVVLVDSDVRFGLGEFDLLNAEVEGGVFPVTNGDSSGFYFKITEPQASITLIPRDDNLDDETGEAISEGIEDFTFTLQQQPGYNIDSNAATVNFTIADDADAQIQVSLTTEPQILIEESETTAVFTLNLSAPPPSEGITVAINSENLSDFDTSGLEVTGGSVVNIGDDGTVDILVTEETATVNLTVNNDGMMEGLETAVFTLVEPGENANYQISLDSEANQSSFDIYDNLSDAPVIVTEESFNDTIATATATNISPETKLVSINGEISGNFFDSELSQRTDLTEDVDIYSLDLQAEDRVTFDIDSIPFENSSGVTLETGADLRLFNAAGEELVYNDEAPAPGELSESGRDAYIDYTVEDAGTYYIGVSQAFNEDYDPNVPASGDGAAFSRFGLGAGEYNLEIQVNPDAPTFDGESTATPIVIEPEKQLPDGLPEVPNDNDGFRTNNDTIPNAVDLGLNLASDNLSVTIEGVIAQRLQRENAVDASEDVDFYSFDLNEGQSITIDIDANGIGDSGLGSALDSVLRIFDAEGNELAINNQGVAPDEIFQAEGDPYLEFTAPAAGTYYAGISNLGNDFYDPFVLGSGSGWTFGERFAPDVYKVEFSLGEMFNPNPPNSPAPEIPAPEFGSVNADIVEVEGSNGIIFAGSSDDLIDASIGSGGRNRIYASSGDDTVILGMSDRIVGGEGADKFFATTGGDNIITGGEGADQFWIATAEIPESANIITDFTSGEDVLGIAGLGIGFEDLSITQQDDNTLIAANGSDLAILQGVGADSLIVDNFAFG
ncbi:MAG: PPC domain-containing protein [Cyanobacteria bacterium P01_A01_bin.80]